MHRLRSFYNRNKKTIFIVGFCIIIGYMIIRYLNNYYIEKTRKMQQSYNNSSSMQKATTVIENQGFDLSEGKKTENTIRQHKDVIDQFYNYCNKKNMLKAYNMLTDECKQSKYPTIDHFENNYYNNIFNTTKSYVIESWNGNTYRVKIQEDILSTGKANNTTFMEDYVTIIDTNNTKKININGYIKKEIISKQFKNEIVTIKVNSKDVYMDYEIYNITIKNNSNIKLLIDDLKDSESIYLTEEKGAKYHFVNYELTKEQLEIISGATVNVSIKFNHVYRNNKQIKSLTFSGIQKQIDGKLENENKDIITIDF